jgi:hypothetical protein
MERGVYHRAANCHGQTISGLALQFGDIGQAAAALGFASVKDLQSAVNTYCTP